MKWCVLASWVSACCLLTGASSADEIDDLVNALKPSPLDHAVWAENLLKAAENLKAPEARMRLHKRVYAYGLKRPKGYPAAIKAARFLAGAQPKDRLLWERKLLAALKLNWQSAGRKEKKEAGREYVDQLIATADSLVGSGKDSEAAKLYGEASYKARYYAPSRKEEIAQRLKDLRERERLRRDVKRCRSVLAENPGNVVVREKLIRLYVEDLDKAAEAKALLTADVGEALRTCVPLAAGKIDSAPKRVCMELGDWYRSLATDASPAGKANVLARAKAYYGRFVKLETNTVQNAIGKAKLAQVEKALAETAVGPRRGQITLTLGKNVTMKLVLIPAGKFLMGSPLTEKRRKVEEVPHDVSVTGPFYLAVTEVTQGQYASIMGKNPAKHKGPQYPVEQVSWTDAVQFCKKLSARTGKAARLPTEAEWEYACRAGAKGRFCFGDDAKLLGDYAWYAANSSGSTQAVGQRKPNAWGLYDMHGNVSEWCSDWYAAPYSGKKEIDPRGPASGSGRILRGGTWKNSDRLCRSAFRYRGHAQRYRTDCAGFRVVVPWSPDMK